MKRRSLTEKMQAIKLCRLIEEENFVISEIERFGETKALTKRLDDINKRIQEVNIKMSRL